MITEQYDLEYDELQDDTSLIIESDGENKPIGKKRRRRLTPVSQKPTRVSARKKARHGEAEVSAPIESTAPANGHTVQSEPSGEVAIPDLKPVNKGSKGKGAKFWYFDEVEGPPAKRPDMVDNPDAILKRKRTKKSIIPMELDPQVNGNPALATELPTEAALQTTEG